MTGYGPFAAMTELERFLGDPADDTNTFSYARCAELDDREEFPAEICAQLEQWGIHRYYVPARFGGRLHSFEDAMHLLRSVARRDMTVAIGHGKTFLGGVSAWVGGDDAQARGVATQVLAGVPVSWGLTEREHGSDLLAGEVSASETPQGFRVHGEKWLINNATRGRLVALLARTTAEGGARGFDVLYIDKDDLTDDTFRCLPKVHTWGIRGADISGVAFDGAQVPRSSRVGPPGSGLEVVLRGLQLTRTMCAGLSLGAGDHALRIAVAELGELLAVDVPPAGTRRSGRTGGRRRTPCSPRTPTT